MSNVQEALKAAIEALQDSVIADKTWSIVDISEAVQKCKSALEALEKCEPVAYIHTATNTDKDGVEWVQLKAIDTSPQPRECEDWQYFDKAYKKATESSEPDDWMNAALLAQQVRRIQLNTKG